MNKKMFLVAILAMTVVDSGAFHWSTARTVLNVIAGVPAY